jgi:hypothetical protein
MPPAFPQMVIVIAAPKVVETDPDSLFVLGK